MEGRIRAGLMEQYHHTIPELDRKGLREFGLVTGGIVAGLFGLGFPLMFGLSYPIWPWVIGGGLAVWALMAPGSPKPVYPLWMRFWVIAQPRDHTDYSRHRLLRHHRPDGTRHAYTKPRPYGTWSGLQDR